MSFNHRKMENQRWQAAEKEAFARWLSLLSGLSRHAADVGESPLLAQSGHCLRCAKTDPVTHL
jgi:hypothetical protein